MADSTKYFFKPRIGKDYEKGFNGYRTMVVGVHLICEYECEHIDRCCSLDGVREMDNQCPCYEEHRKGENADYYRLGNDNVIELETYIYNDGKSPSFSAFTKYLLKEPGYVSPERKLELWDKLCFCNYLQCFRPNSNTPSYENYRQLYDDCLPAFKALLREQNPQRLYVWSDELCECLRNHRIKGLDYYGETDMQVKRVHLFYYNTIPGTNASNEKLSEYINRKTNGTLPPETVTTVAEYTKRAINAGYLRFDGEKMHIEKKTAVSFLCLSMMKKDSNLRWKHFDAIYCHNNLRGAHYDKVSTADENNILSWMK